MNWIIMAAFAVAGQHAEPTVSDAIPTWLGIVLGVGGVFVGGGVQWGITTTRVSRLEQDVCACASKERVEALEKLIAAHHDGLEKKLDKLEEIMEALRAEFHVLQRGGHTGGGR